MLFPFAFSGSLLLLQPVEYSEHNPRPLSRLSLEKDLASSFFYLQLSSLSLCVSLSLSGHLPLESSHHAVRKPQRVHIEKPHETSHIERNWNPKSTTSIKGHIYISQVFLTHKICECNKWLFNATKFPCNLSHSHITRNIHHAIIYLFFGN